jgi:hypothetical protein
MPMTRNLIGNDVVPDFTAAPGETTEAHEEGRYQSVLAELDLAFTWCGITASATDRWSTDCNIENAKKAYSDGLYYLIGASSCASLSRQARHRVMVKLALLDTKFRELGV